MFCIFCNLFVTYSIIVICNNCTHEIAWRSKLLCLQLANTLPNGSNVNNCLNTKISSYLETSGGQSSNLYLNVVQFFNNRHLWQLKTVVFWHWCLMCAVLIHVIKASFTGPFWQRIFYVFAAWKRITLAKLVAFSGDKAKIITENWCKTQCQIRRVNEP